jgi:hypothetical protein
VLAGGKFTAPSPAGLKTVTPRGETKVMTSRYAHKRLATLRTAVQSQAPARVIEWPQIVHRPEESRGPASAEAKPTLEKKNARK